MKVSVASSCYNEKDTMEKIIEAVGNALLADREITPSGISAFNFCSISSRNPIQHSRTFDAITASTRKRTRFSLSSAEDDLTTDWWQRLGSDTATIVQ